MRRVKGGQRLANKVKGGPRVGEQGKRRLNTKSQAKRVKGVQVAGEQGKMNTRGR